MGADLLHAGSLHGGKEKVMEPEQSEPSDKELTSRVNAAIEHFVVSEKGHEPRESLETVPAPVPLTGGRASLWKSITFSEKDVLEDGSEYSDSVYGGLNTRRSTLHEEVERDRCRLT